MLNDMIKALIFDCFGVFYADPVATYVNDPRSPKNKSYTLQKLDEKAARDEVTKAEFDAEAAALLDVTTETIEKQFFHSGERNRQLIDFIQTLRKDYKVAVLSNIGSDMMDGFFTQAERKVLFDEFILSGDVGLAKPDPAIFQLACDRFGVHPSEAVMIDDHLSNVDAAKRIGMQGIGYRDFDQFVTELGDTLG